MKDINNFFELVDIDDIILDDVYRNTIDIQVDTDESFCLANGIISHNSASTMAISGMSVVGRDYYGAFPLRGKVLNVRGASPAKIKANAEVQSLINILGLEFNKKYTDTSELRYGKCVIMTDADCVHEDTFVILNNGSKYIKDIKVGDIVKSHTGYNKVLGIKESIKDEYINITIGNDVLRVGLNHAIPVCVDIDSLEVIVKKAKDICLTDYIFKNDAIIKINNIEHITNDEQIFYDIEVENDNTFFISSSKDNEYGYLVHNCDGIHIKGLLINFFETFFPELLKMDFLYEFITPILKAKKGKEVKSFYTIKEYKKALESGKLNNYSIKYYKGLGTSTPQEAREYFKELEEHLLPFQWDTDDNTEYIDMVFNDKKAEERKEWLLETTPIEVEKYKTPTPMSSFIHNEMITFSLSDNIRSIPYIYDGLKPSHRKILATCIKRNIVNEIPVSSLAGSVKEKMKYHHGEVSLEQGIVNLAQDFVGSNNINILQPEGQFGSRLHGGKDAASSRYINTYLSPISKFIYRSEDNDILDYLEDDGVVIEPETYKPIIPMVLVNGAEGIGTGWSTSIPKYNPSDIIRVIENKISGKRSNRIHPWYKGFKGEIIEKENGNYISRGVFEYKNSTTIHITELPIGTWTYNYISFLNKMVEDKFIKDVIDMSSEDSVDITIVLSRENMMSISKEEDFIKLFKMESNLYTSNMHLFSGTKIIKYDSPMDIINEFYDLRLEDYKKRKSNLLAKLEMEKSKLENIVKFINLVITDKLVINNRKKDLIIKDIVKNKLEMFDNSYNYLLNMSIYSLTKEKVDELNKLLKEKIASYKELKSKKETDLWLEDLAELKKMI